MPRKTDYVDFTETGNWNVAADYSKLKIMKLLFEADEYEKVATFGTSEMGEEYMIDENMKNIARIKALKRLVKTLQMLINNTVFAVKKDAVKKLTEYKKDLDKIEKVFPLIQNQTRNEKTKQLSMNIREDYFDYVLKLLINIKFELNTPLNQADLIFTSIEEFDPDKLKAEIMEDLIEGG